MGRLGIVLAAGESSRLPNKALLPISDEMIAIESGINLLKRYCEKVVVVVGKDSLIPLVLQSRNHNDLHYVTQEVRLGAFAAIHRLSGMFTEHSSIIVTFCDNIFHRDERIPFYLGIPIASVRHSSNPQLDRYVDGRWVGRSIDRITYPAFAGWLEFSWQHMATYTGEHSMIGWLSVFSSYHVVGDAAFGWHDIGTEDSYATYLKDIIVSRGFSSR